MICEDKVFFDAEDEDIHFMRKRYVNEFTGELVEWDEYHARYDVWQAWKVIRELENVSIIQAFNSPSSSVAKRSVSLTVSYDEDGSTRIRLCPIAVARITELLKQKYAFDAISREPKLMSTEYADVWPTLYLKAIWRKQTVRIKRQGVGFSEVGFSLEQDYEEYEETIYDPERIREVLEAEQG